MKLRSVKTRYFVLHPTSYGVGTLGRVGFRLPDGRSILLHYFPPQDASERYHDHPWPFTTLILWGGYTDLTPCEKCAGTGRELHRWQSAMGEREVREKCTRCDGSGHLAERVRMGTVHRRRAKHRHKTIVPHRTFTLIVTGRTEREWCEGDHDEWLCGGQPEDFVSTLGMPK